MVCPCRPDVELQARGYGKALALHEDIMAWLHSPVKAHIHEEHEERGVIMGDKDNARIHLRFYDEQVGVPHDLGGGNLSQI